VQFISVYIREAHPVDGWWLGEGIMGTALKLIKSKVSTDVYDPKDISERRAVASDCEVSLQYGIRTYVDEMDDRVNKAYAAWPARTYLVGIDGKVVFKGGTAPFSFHPKKLGSAIDEYLAQIKT